MLSCTALITKHSTQNIMKQKKLLFLFLLLCGFGLFAQEKFGPEQIIVGQFVGQTMPLRDFPTIPENLNLDPKTLIPSS